MGEQYPHRRLPVMLFAIGAGVLGYFILQSLIVGLLAPVIVIASTAELFMPIRYRLDEKGARSKCGFSVTVILWPEVKRIIEMPGAIRLSPLRKSGRSDAFRGVLLRFASNEAEVWAKLRELLADDEDILGRRTDSGAGGEHNRETDQGDRQTEIGGTGHSCA